MMTKYLKQTLIMKSETLLYSSESYYFHQIAVLIGHTNTVSVLTILQSTQSIVSASRDTTIKVWNSTSFTLIATLNGHTGTINALIFLRFPRE